MPDQALPTPASSHLNFATVAKQTLPRHGNSLPWGFFADRYAYSQRVLSHPAYAMDAFRGILRLHPYVTFWGIPVTRRDWLIDPLLGFAMAYFGGGRHQPWLTICSQKDATRCLPGGPAFRHGVGPVLPIMSIKIRYPLKIPYTEFTSTRVFPLIHAM